MPLCKILVDYENVEGWKVGDVVDISDPRLLVKEGKVEVVGEQPVEVVEDVQDISIDTE